MSRCSICAILLLWAFSVNSQTADVPASGNPTFKSRAQLVLVDVVVIDGQGHPLMGLKKDDFEVFEAANVRRSEKQVIASFEEHKGTLTAREARDGAGMAGVKRSPLGLHFYTNAPLAQQPGSINVLLLDSLNTEYGDQATVRLQMLEYLKTIDPGPQLAIFTLGSQLRMVEGFNSDPKALIEALNHKHWGGMPKTSTQQASGSNNLDQERLTQLALSGTVPGQDEAIDALSNFISEEKGAEDLARIYSTLHAMQGLSRYLSGFHGRKNIIWFAGSFPRIGLPVGPEVMHISRNDSLSGEIGKTVNILASAQVAIYPIAAQGLETQSFYQATNLLGRTRIANRSLQQSPEIEGPNQALERERKSRYLNQLAASEIAANTGGIAFFNTNSLKDALAEAVHLGTHYYRLSYSPSDKTREGRYRHIEVRLSKRAQTGGYKLAYRRGYVEEDEKENRKTEKSVTTRHSEHLLQPLMRRGLPDATELIYNLRLFRSQTQPQAGASPLGDNKELNGPVIRIAADFFIPVDALDFDLSSDGMRSGNLELALVAYDHAGKPFNWIVRSFRTSLKPDVYPAVQKTGIQFHQELDVPTTGNLYLRTGIYDLQSHRAGTIEIPLSDVPPEDIGSTEVQNPAGMPAVAASPGLSSQKTPVAPSIPTPNSSDTNSATRVSTLESIAQVPPVSSSPSPESSTPAANDLESTIHAYCTGASQAVQHSAALASICEFALSTRKRFPNLICDRETKRYWTEYRSTWAGGNGVGALDEVKHSDVLTAKVAYRDGKEYYDDLRLDGQLVGSGASALPPQTLAGAWSVGEFAMVLEAVFLPSSKADFHFIKRTHVGSANALLFTFHVAASNNLSYFLFANDEKWFPEYGGELWIDENGFQLLRLLRETARMPQYPIRSVKTTIEYAPVVLADTSTTVLPVKSEITTCMPPMKSNTDECSRSIVRFTHWQKFKATTNIVASPAP